MTHLQVKKTHNHKRNALCTTSIVRWALLLLVFACSDAENDTSFKCACDFSQVPWDDPDSLDQATCFYGFEEVLQAQLAQTEESLISHVYHNDEQPQMNHDSVNYVRHEKVLHHYSVIDLPELEGIFNTVIAAFRRHDIFRATKVHVVKPKNGLYYQLPSNRSHVYIPFNLIMWIKKNTIPDKDSQYATLCSYQLSLILLTENQSRGRIEISQRVFGCQAGTQLSELWQAGHYSLGFSKSYVHLADLTGAIYMCESGFNPLMAYHFWNGYAEEQSVPPPLQRIFNNLPMPKQRANCLLSFLQDRCNIQTNIKSN